MQTLINESVIDTCNNEGVSPEQVFFRFSLLFALLLWAI